MGASIWLCLLRARSSRRSLSLLNSLGDVPWHGSWDYSWHSPAIYACVPIFPKFSSLGPFTYIGESDNFARRVAEHMSRLLCPHGAVQQPFFQFVRDDATRPDLLRMSVCEWLFFPLVHAPGDSSARKLLEKQWIKKIGTLNPPRVHVLARARSGLRPPHAGLAIFDAPRPVLRLRKVQKLDRPARHSVAQLALKSWKDGLRFTAAALAGHQFAGCKAAALSVWRLSRSAWIWVVHHISRHEDGWRRRRALQMLRRVTRTRRDLPQPISIMNCSIPWLGSNVARTLILQVVRRLLADWRRSGFWLPVMRHARLRAQWKATPTLADALCKGPALTELLGASRPPDCVCSHFLALDPRWPIVTVDGVSHIAASQGHIPWPDNLACFARLPANLCLPPKSGQVTSAVRAFLRSVRDRCKVADEDLLVESAVVGLSDALGELLTKNQNRLRAPVTWEQVEAARLFLRSFFVQVFDHNLCRFGAFCPALVRLQACRVLDFGDQASGMDFAWDAGRNYSEVLISLATVQHLPSHLQPARLSITATRSWSIGQPIILPKWKAPGIKWRLVVNKHSAPTTGLHSAVSKAIDVALNHMPRETWGDFSSSVSFLDLVADFNQRVQERFESCCVWTEAADMVDCYHHLPCDQAPLVWDAVATFLSNRGIHFISVPRRKGFCLGRFGQCLDAGWVCFSLDQIRLVLQNFAATNFISLPGYLGRELRGAPMGDALSGAVLRLFKWRRESLCASHEAADTVSFPGTCCKHVLVKGVNILVLDVSYRDDIRLFCAWDSAAILEKREVARWAGLRLRRRFCVGTMQLEPSEHQSFIGLNTSWFGTKLVVWPCFPDPLGSLTYDIPDFRSLKPWNSWAPASQKAAAIKGWMCRIWYLSNSAEVRMVAWHELFCSLGLAGFPHYFVARIARRWARTWTPKCGDWRVGVALDEINRVLGASV